MAGLVGYGGDPKIVASRTEIERVSGHLAHVGHDLIHRLFDLLPNPVHRAQIDAVVPDFSLRIYRVRLALAATAENYFTQEAKVAHSIEATGHTLRDHPWLLNLLPPGTREELKVAGLVGFGLAQVAPGNLGAEATRFLASSQNIDQRVASAKTLGLLADKPITAREVFAFAGKPTKTLEDVGLQLRDLNDKKAEIRIERYLGSQGQSVLVVYIPGTQSLSPLGGQNPFDLATDTALATKPQSSQLVSAIEKAIEKSGGSHARVILAGYSLGGMASAALAARGNFEVSGVITIGSPVGQFALPKDVPVLSIEHSNDPVPAATGQTNPLTENWATVSRQMELAPGQLAVEAHDLDGYRETLSLTQRSEIPGVTRVREMIFSQLAEAKLVEVSGYELLRDTR